MSDTKRLTYKRSPLPGFYDDAGKYWGRTLVEARARQEMTRASAEELKRIAGLPGRNGDRLD